MTAGGSHEDALVKVGVVEPLWDTLGPMVAMVQDQILGESVEVRIVHEDAATSRSPVRVTVQGQQRPFPSQVFWDAVAYARGGLATVSEDDNADDLAEALRGLDVGEATEALTLVASSVCATTVEAPETPGAMLVEVHVAPSLLDAITADTDGTRFTVLRDGIFETLGLPVPSLQLRADPSLRTHSFSFRVNGVPSVPRVGLAPATLLVNDTVENLRALGIEAVPTLNPATCRPASIVAAEHQERLEADGWTVWDAPGYLVLAAAELMRENARVLMSDVVVGDLLNQLGRAFPLLESSVARHVGTAPFAELLRQLLSDRVPVRNLRRIAELVLLHQALAQADGGVDRLTFVRRGLADLIAFETGSGLGAVVVYLLDPALEHVSAPDLLCAAVHDEFATLPPTAQRPAILTDDDLRPRLAEMLRPVFPRVRVLGHGDLPTWVNVQPVARISVPVE